MINIPFGNLYNKNCFFNIKCVFFILTAKAKLKKSAKYAQDNRLSKREFRTFVQAVTDEISGADSFDYYIEFLTNSVEVGLYIICALNLLLFPRSFFKLLLFCVLKHSLDLLPFHLSPKHCLGPKVAIYGGALYVFPGKYMKEIMRTCGLLEA